MSESAGTSRCPILGCGKSKPHVHEDGAYDRLNADRIFCAADAAIPERALAALKLLRRELAAVQGIGPDDGFNPDAADKWQRLRMARQNLEYEVWEPLLITQKEELRSASEDTTMTKKIVTMKTVRRVKVNLSVRKEPLVHRPGMNTKTTETTALLDAVTHANADLAFIGCGETHCVIILRPSAVGDADPAHADDWCGVLLRGADRLHVSHGADPATAGSAAVDWLAIELLRASKMTPLGFVKFCALRTPDAEEGE